MPARAQRSTLVTLFYAAVGRVGLVVLGVVALVVIGAVVSSGGCDSRPSPSASVRPQQPLAMKLLRIAASPQVPAPAVADIPALPIAPPTLTKAEQLRQDLAAVRAEVDRTRAAALDTLHNGVDYFIAKNRAETAKRALDESRQTGETVSRLRLGSEANNTAAAVQKMDADGLANDPDYHAAVPKATRLQANLDAAVAAEPPEPKPVGVAATAAEPPTLTPPSAADVQPPVSGGSSAVGAGEHVGPRGGVYHLSASGKKVYKKRQR